MAKVQWMESVQPSKELWQKVRNREAVVVSAKDFYECARKSLKGVTVLYVPKSQIDEYKEMLEARSKLARAIPAIKSQHHFQFLDTKNLIVSRTYKSERKKCMVLKDSTINNEAVTGENKLKMFVGKKPEIKRQKTSNGGKINIKAATGKKKRKICVEEQKELKIKKQKTIGGKIETVILNSTKSKGKPTVLAVTRNTNTTTAKEFVDDELNIPQGAHVKWNYNDVYNSPDTDEESWL